jgi:predicted MarR family transcription regulator
VEFALTMMNNAYHRWMVRCMTAAGGPAMSPLEVLILHLVHHRGRAKTLAEVCLILNIEDTHLANYAIRKLTQAKL